MLFVGLGVNWHLVQGVYPPAPPFQHPATLSCKIYPSGKWIDGWFCVQVIVWAVLSLLNSFSPTCTFTQLELLRVS